jgi:hypothetical protein
MNKETKQITKKITNNEGYIEQHWNEVVKKLELEKGTNKYTTLRYCFYLGAMLTFEKVIEIGRDNSMDVGEIKLESISQELEIYREEIRQEVKEKKDATTTS